jgi:tetratricopeptide (TPR) repeat protein
MAKKKSQADDKSFTAALKAAENSPDSEDGWDHVEDLADQLQRPDEVGELYRTVLETDLSRDVRNTVAERAVQFHEEWFGDTPDAITQLLTNIMEKDPSADWAFDRLVVTLTSAEQWGELLTVYDRRLDTTRDPGTRKQLLDDATGVARDFAKQPERAADYLRQLLDLDPKNEKRAAALERLYERQERYADLIDLWKQRAERLDPGEARKLRVKIATCFLDRLDDSEQALGALERIVTESPGHEKACEQLERILSLGAAEEGIRLRALSLLRKNYQASERPEDVVRVLEQALGFVADEDAPQVRREIGTRLAILGKDTEAMAHYTALLEHEPADTDARKQLRQLAKRSDRSDLHAGALIAAAEGSEDPALSSALVLDAAQIYRDFLDDTEKAIELYTKVLGTEDVEPSTALAAAHSLNELLASAGRSEDRLAVLEQLGKLERASAVRRSLLGEAAMLAAQLGQLDRALEDWNRRLEADDRDLEALDAIVEVLETSERWGELVDALRRRASATTRSQQRRADLIRAASIQKEQLEDVGAAIDTWNSVREEFGDAPDVLAALDGLMATAMRWGELADVLQQSAGTGREQAARLLSRLGDIQRVHLDKAREAATAYAQALGVDASNDVARMGLRALLEDENCVRDAASALATAYRSTGDWEQLLEILEPRLASRGDAAERVRVLREAAQLYERRSKDTNAALAAMARALPSDPADLTLEHELVRLGEATEDWGLVAKAFSAAATAAEAIPARAAQLHHEAGRLYELKLGDASTATDQYAAAAEFDASRIESFEALGRTAASASKWEAASTAAIASTRMRDRLPTELFEQLEQAAGAGEDWPSLLGAFDGVLRENASSLRTELARDLEAHFADWYLLHSDDDDAAEAALSRALVHDPSDRENLARLASLQRRSPNAALVETLFRIDGLVDRDLDPLQEAATVALEHVEDPALVQDTLERLYRRAAGLWAHGEKARGQHGAPSACAWALGQLVERYESGGEIELAARLLVDGAKLPVQPTKSREFRQQAAELLAKQGHRARALELYREVLAESPDDLETLGRMATLSQQEDRISELLGLRLKQLDLTEDPDKRIELRLELSRLSGELESRGGRIGALEANLRERPGHAESIEQLAAIFEERARFDPLVELLEKQGSKLGEEDAARAALLWGRAAGLAETELHDVDRAVQAHQKVVELATTTDALDALARLELHRDQPAVAARWLEQRLETAPEKARVAVLLQLARARIRAEQQDGAVEALETAFAEAPRNAEVRKLLIGLYRQREDWAALARTLSTATEHAADEDTMLAYASEAAELFYAKLDQPENAVPVLEKALEITPDDRTLKSMLADGLRVAGRLDEAKKLLSDLIAGFGRRRSSERAGMHLQLARVVHAQGNVDEAIDQLEQASKMDAGNVQILKTLAELARQSDQLERAERAYRTLLLNVRRTQEATEIGQCEILLELSFIAKARDQEDQAEELVESALDALSQNDDEAEAVQAMLGEREDIDLLRRILETRLQHVHGPHRRASIFGELGKLLGGPLEDPEGALEALLSAVSTDPGSPLHHDAAQELAQRVGQGERYVSTIESLLENARRDADAYVRCELLLRLAIAVEGTELDRATDLVKQAEETGVRQVDVWRAGARIAGARGDTDEQMRLLEQLTALGADQAETRADALYRLAEVQLSVEDTVDVGIETLRKALDDDPRYERAGIILQRATDTHEDHSALLDVYERCSRRSGDEAMLLHYLERRSGHSEATAEHTKEGAELALRLEEFERAEKLMLRAVEIGEGLLDGLGEVDWALSALARRRLAGGDLAGAVKWFGQAAEVADLDSILGLAAEITQATSGPDGDPSLAIKLYEKLLERDATIRAAWEPLAELYIHAGRTDRLERLVEETLDGLQDTADRNALRVKLGKALLLDEDRADDAMGVLRDVLLEDPQHDEAQELLAEHLERAGKTEELLELLRNQLMAAQGSGNLDAIKATSIRLARRLAAEDPAEAESVYRNALDSAPADPDLLRALLEHLGLDHEAAERAELMERLLQADDPQSAATLTRELVALREDMEDEAGVLRALEIGYSRNPGDLELRELLEQSYRDRGDFVGLARVLSNAAEETEDADAKLTLLKEAAVVYRDLLHDPGTAADLLRKATELAPDDPGLKMETANTLTAAGDHQGAIELVTVVLDATGEDDPVRAQLLATRAAILSSSGDEGSALEDLEAAFAIDPQTAALPLEGALQRQRSRAQEDGNTDTERAITMRLVEVNVAQGQREEARTVLQGWTDRARRDTEALHQLLGLAETDEAWDMVAAVCDRLVALESGDAQVDAALSLSKAHQALGQPQEARAGLEHAQRKQPENKQIRQELRSIYEQSGADAELAQLLLQDAGETEDAEEKLDMLRQAGQLLIATGDGETAIGVLQQILELAPGDPYSTAVLADAHLQQGNLDEAEQLLDTAIGATKSKRSPELSQFQHRKARIAEARGDTAGHLESLQAAFSTDKKNGVVAAELADLAERLENYELAVKTLRSIAMMDGGCPITRGMAFLRQGRIAAMQGDTKRATLWARRARQEEPENPEVTAFLEEIGA